MLFHQQSVTFLVILTRNHPYTCAVEDFRSRIKYDILEHVVVFNLSSRESRSAFECANFIDAWRISKDEPDPDRCYINVNSFSTCDSRLAACHVLCRDRERLVRIGVLCSHENILTVPLHDRQSYTSHLF